MNTEDERHILERPVLSDSKMKTEDLKLHGPTFGLNFFYSGPKNIDDTQLLPKKIAYQE